PSAHRRGHWLLDQTDPARACAFGGLLDGAALDLRRAVRYADQYARTGTHETIAMHLLDEVLQHLLSDGEVGDHAVLHRTDRRDVSRRASQHVLRFLADRFDLLAGAARLLANRDHRWLVQHDALAANVDQCVGGAQIDRKVVRKIPSKILEHGCCESNGRTAVGGQKSCGTLAMGRTQHKLKVYDCARFFSTFRPCFGASRFIRECMRETGAASCRAPFMSLTREHVESIAHLARLAITQDELPAYVDSLSRILSFVEQLNAVEARDVEPMAHP